MKKYLITIIFLSVLPFLSHAQDTTVKERKLSLELGIGANFNITPQISLPGLSYQNISTGSTITFFYESEYLIKIGFESGYLPITGINNQIVNNEFGNTNVNTQLSAIPLLFTFTLDYANFYITYGHGLYLMFSYIDAFELISRSAELVAGSSIGLSYKYPINDNWKVGAVTKLYYMWDAGNSVIFSGIIINYNLLKY
jgi:hypothetical protein